MNKKSVTNVAIVFHPGKEGAREASLEAERILYEAGIASSRHEYQPYPEPCATQADLLRKVASVTDALIVLGGDGTLLGVARCMADSDIPIMGINLGSFGFLTSSTRDELANAVECLIHGNIRTVNRYMLEVRILNQENECIFHASALNEALTTLATPGRLLRIFVSVDTGTSLVYSADGLIVATPTGSTGHSLSAGGPILEPHLPALIITPVSPHSLFNRPLVVDGERELTLSFQPGTEALQLILDGQVCSSLQATDTVILKRSSKTIPMLSLPDRNFIQVLRLKFNLGNA